jgi:hypothetical protein
VKDLSNTEVSDRDSLRCIGLHPILRMTYDLCNQPLLSMPTLHTEPTPNPNSIKITSDDGPFIDGGLVSIASKDEADAHPLGRLLYAVDGVANVLILPQFVTISKADGHRWEEVLPAIKEILQDHLADANA